MADVAELVTLIEPLARHFFGEPNRARSSKTELRFGSHGSLSIDLEKGTWFDFETQEGGGVVDLVRRQKGFHSDGECMEWLEHDGYLHAENVVPLHGGNGKHKAQQQLGAEVAHYDYVNEAGHLLFQVVRFDPKDFRQRVRDDTAPSGWRYTVKGVRQVPYRLPDLVEALASERLVFIVEGEKDVDRLWQEGAPATTNAGGAGKWRTELNKYFTDADVVIIADNDPQMTNKAGELLFHLDGRPKFAGFDHAHQVAAELNNIAARVRVLDLGKHWPSCPLKGDVTDWFEQSGTLELLYAVVEGLPDWDDSQAKREQEPQEPQEPAPIRRATPYVAPDPAAIPARGWLHAGHYIRQAATATVAPGGFGKTTLTIHEAINMVAAGLAVWYLSGEDPKVEIDRRIAAHCQHHKIDLKALPGRLFVDDKATFALTVATAPRAGVTKFDDASLTQFEYAITEDKIDVVMLDPFIAFHTVPENDNGSIDAVVKRLAAIAQRTDSCIEISHHVRKLFSGQTSLSVEDARGGSALINAVRSGRVINRMTGHEAEQAKVSSDDRHFYVRIDRGKRNMAPPDKANWFHLVSVILPNHDNVQALEAWKFPSLFEGISVEDTEWVRTLVLKQPYRCDSRSDQWLGIEVAKRLKLNVNDKADCMRINKIIGVWLSNSVFKKVELKDDTRRLRMFYAAVDAQRDDETSNVVRLFDREDKDDD